MSATARHLKNVGSTHGSNGLRYIHAGNAGNAELAVRIAAPNKQLAMLSKGNAVLLPNEQSPCVSFVAAQCFYSPRQRLVTVFACSIVLHLCSVGST